MQFIEDELKAYQSSPEQIAGRLKRLQGISLHHETIYRYILKDKASGGELYLHLRHKQKPYRKRYASSTNSTKGIPDRVDIDQRPQEVNDRLRVGDWEGDTVIVINILGDSYRLKEKKEAGLVDSDLYKFKAKKSGEGVK